MRRIDSKLVIQAISKYLMGIVLVGILLFLPAGTFAYWNAWVMMAALFLPMLIAGVIMLAYSPDLLRKRLNDKETDSEQRSVVAWSGLMFIASFVLAGLDYRFTWTSVPLWVIWTSVAVLILSYLMYAEVMRENAYLSRTIEVQSGQKVIDSGLYGVVRHPMYASTILLFLSIPLVLGSLPAFVVMLAYLPIINARMVNEERVLSKGLEGYDEYKRQVRYKVIPFIW